VSRVAQQIPKVGLVMEEVKVVRWLKNVGDDVVAGEPLLEVETEKSVVEIDAAATGRLSQILVQAEGQAVVGDQIAWIESLETAGAAAPAALRSTDPQAAAPASPAVVPPIVPPTTPAAAMALRGGERIRSTPVARKLAAAHGIALGGIVGTGPGGRIQLEEVQRTIGAPRAALPAALSLSPMRRALVRAMTLSNATIPQFTVSRSVDWTELHAQRHEFAASLADDAPKLSVNDFLLQAVARSLIEYPALNATFSGDPLSADACLVQANGAHIGLVVAVDDGLLVPVIHDVERLGLVEIARRRRDCIKRSLIGRLKHEDMGATFSISNLGAKGPDRFTAIINPPQSAILAVGRERDCVVTREGAIVVRLLSDLTLTVDHRVADGRLASQFLARLTEILEGREWRLDEEPI
jgi:pyruvate dehydrogenase E2 component (dihydrolipoamide acetyltransferase)